MKVYLISLAVGLGVGVIYGLLGVRSPAPPIIALIGLLGMLIGEQLVPWFQHRVLDVRAMTHVADHTPKSARTNGNSAAPANQMRSP